MSLIIGGDVRPSKQNSVLFENGDVRSLLGDELLALLTEAEHVVVNLELPLCNALHPIKKCGPAFAAPVDCVNGLKAAHIDAVSLANNHIMDQGEDGLRSTMKALNENEVAYFSAGEELSSARKPFFIDACGRRFGFIACTEHEFSCAEENIAGANPFDPLTIFDDVADAKSRCDMLVVLYHGGKELYRYPSPRLRKVCRRFAEKGADLVLCQHCHCIGCAENYSGATIVYGTGNFLFDGVVNEYTQNGLLVAIDDEGKIDFKPITVCGHGVKAASAEEAAEIMKGFAERSRQIAEEGFVEKTYRAFAEEQKYGILTCFYGKESFVFRALNRLSHNRLRARTIRKKYGESGLLRIECEAWSELSAAVLKNEIGN